MKELTTIIHNPAGLHARPAKIFVKMAKQFEAKIEVFCGAKKANGKSLISMLALGVGAGKEIRLVADGADEDMALETLQTSILAGLGEGDQIEAHKVARTPAPDPEPEMETAVINADDGVVRGIAAAPGLVIGPTFRLRQAELELNETFTSAAQENGRLQTALTQAASQLAALRQQMVQTAGAKEAAIFDVHRELIDDPDLLAVVREKIGEQQPAATAWRLTIEERAAAMAALPDPLLAERAADIRDVGGRVLRLLVNRDQHQQAWPDHPIILLAEDLSPSDTASLPKELVLGFCTAVGGPTAHSAILARALNLPAVVSAGAEMLAVADGTMAILNGRYGTLTLEPDEATIEQARQQQQQWQQQQAVAASMANKPALTMDGHHVEVVANIGGVAEAKAALAAGAEGVGLLRTEFLFLERTVAPTEEEQFAVYRDIAKAMQGQPVIVRTLDIGGDKPLAYIDVPHEENPFLGERGIRLCLNRPALLRQQLRAILRAAKQGTLRIMFPMVADIGELRAARAHVDEVRRQVGGVEVEIGMMIEVPSAALMADVLAAEVDFFSVGTNDLTQYTLAMDRQHPLLASKSDGLHPAVLRLIATTVKAAHAAGKWVGVCGELAADAQAVPILLGLGVDELSVSVPSIPAVKAQIRTQSFVAAQALAKQALLCATAQDVRTLVEQSTFVAG